MLVVFLVMIFLLCGCQNAEVIELGNYSSGAGHSYIDSGDEDSELIGWPKDFNDLEPYQIDAYINKNFNVIAKNKIEEKIKNTDRLVLVYLSDTCKYCKYVLTILKKIEEAYVNTEFYVVRYSYFADYYKEQFDITGIPRIVVYIDGEEKAKFGFQPDIAEFIRNFSPLD